MVRAVLVWIALLPMVAGAQQTELRVDAIWTTTPTWFGGFGITWRAGNYARVSAIGASTLGIGHGGRALRGDVIGRLTLDPFRRRRVGASIGGGISVIQRPFLVALVDLEGPLWGPVTPALQLGVGGGYRAAIVLRGGYRDRR